ncbi:MAG: hypothetical protein AB7D07_12600 [Desulfovibrionaceae bacterium]
MKRFTVVLALASLLILAASQAWAVNLQSMNSSQGYYKWQLQGYSIYNGTSASGGPAARGAVMSTIPFGASGLFNITAGAPSIGNWNTTLKVRNQSGTAFSSNSSGDVGLDSRNVKEITFPYNGGPQANVTGFLAFRNFNPTVTLSNRSVVGSLVPSSYWQGYNGSIFAIVSPAGSAVFGAANFGAYKNSTKTAQHTVLNGTSEVNGTTFVSLVNQAKNSVPSSVLRNGDTWSFYSVMYMESAPQRVGYRAGTFKWTGTSSKNVTATYFDSLTTTVYSDKSFNASYSTNGNMTIGNSAGLLLVGNGTMDNSTNVIVSTFKQAGVSSVANASVVYTVALKGAAVMSQSDFNQGWKLVASAVKVTNTSSTGAHQILSPMTALGDFYADSDGKLTGAWVPTTRAAGAGGMVTAPINLGDRNYGATVSTMSAVSAGSSKRGPAVDQTKILISNETSSKLNTMLMGRYSSSAGLVIGMYLGNSTDYNHVGVFVAAKATGSAGAVTVGVYGNATGVTVASLNSTGIGYAYSPGGTPGAGIGWTAMQTTYGLSGWTPVTDGWKSFNCTYTGGYPATIAFAYPLTGVSGKVALLSLKKINNSTAKSAGGTGLARNGVTDFTWSTTADYTQDGAWWISAGSAGGAAVDRASVLKQSETYYVNFVVKDQGSYDTDAYKAAQAGSIVDPTILLSGTPTTSSSSSSSSGCVFNPAAGFGLEWLLLLLAPAIGIIRSRFKK